MWNLGGDYRYVAFKIATSICDHVSGRVVYDDVFLQTLDSHKDKMVEYWAQVEKLGPSKKVLQKARRYFEVLPLYCAVNE
jgi:hypothetical protein